MNIIDIIFIVIIVILAIWFSFAALINKYNNPLSNNNYFQLFLVSIFVASAIISLIAFIFKIEYGTSGNSRGSSGRARRARMS